MSIYIIITIVVSIVLVLITSFILINEKKREKIVNKSGAKEFYPPEGLNSAEVAFLYNNRKTTDESIISLLISLMNEGYIKIEKNELDDNKEIRIVKLKEYNKTDKYKKYFMEGLFNRKTKIDETLFEKMRKGEIDSSEENLKKIFIHQDNIRVDLIDLKYIFCDTNNKIKEELKYSLSKRKYSVLIGMMQIVISILMLAKPIYEYTNFEIEKCKFVRNDIIKYFSRNWLYSI